MSTRQPLALLCLLLCAACGGPGDASGDLAGTYLLDRDQLAQDLLKERMGHLDAGTREALDADRKREMLAEVKATAALSDVRLDLLADGTFAVRYRYGEEEGRRSGAWRREGSRVVLRTTQTTDGPLAEPSEVAGTSANGLLRFLADEDVPHPFTLRRR